MPRFTLVPDPSFMPLRARLRERVEAAGAALTPETFKDLLDAPMRSILQSAFADVGAHAGTVWFAVYPPAESIGKNADGCLVPVFSTGPGGERFEREFRQPLNRGLVSMVFKNQRPFCENQVYANQGQDKTIDTATGMLTCAMIVVPLHFADETRGVVSCVQLKPAGSSEPDPPGFGPGALDRIHAAAVVLSRLIDHVLVGMSVGWHVM
jgi:hypothetical protein